MKSSLSPRALVMPSVLLISLATSLSAQSGALKLPAAAVLNGRSYGIEFGQVIMIENSQGTAEINRNVQLRVTAAAQAAAGRTTLTIRIDSARGTVSNPHAREVLDLRSLAGVTQRAVVADSGRPVTWEATSASISFGETGGTLPLHAFLEMLVPSLPARPVRAGASWERTWSQQVLIGQHHGQQLMRTRFTVRSSERTAGGAGWRIGFTTSSVASTGSGAVATGSMLVGADGVLHELTLEEKRRGSDWEFSGQTLPYEQVDRWTITLRSGSAERR